MTTCKRQGIGGYKRERHGAMFTLPQAEKTPLNDLATSRSKTIMQTLVDGLHRLNTAHDMTPIRDE